MRKRLHWFCCFLLCVVDGYGQCPDAVLMRKKIDQARVEPVSNWGLLFGRLKAEHETCRLAPDSNYANILFALSYAHSVNRQFEKAYQLARKCIAINESGKPGVKPDELCKNYHYLGYYLQNLGRSTEAVAAYQKSVQVNKGQRHNTITVARSLKSVASLLYDQGDYEKALNSADLGYRYGIIGHDALIMSENLYYSGECLAQLGQTTSAEEQIRRAIQLVDSLPHASANRYMYKLRLAELLFLNKRPDDGLKLYRSLIAEPDQDGDQIGYVYNDIGYQYLTVLKNYKKAAYYFNQACSRFTSPYEKANTLSNMALVEVAQKRYVHALAFLQQSLRAYPIQFKGKALTDNPALTEIRVASDKEKLLPIISAKADIWLAYARATKNNRQYLQHALDTYQVADQMIDLMRWEHTGQQSKLYWRQKTRGMYERAVETCYWLGNTEQAFRFFEKSRAVMLSDKLNELGARQQLPPQQADEERRLRQAVTERQNKLMGITPDSVIYASARMSLLTVQDSLDALRKQLEATNNAYYRYKYDNAIPALADVKHYLVTRKASFVTYFVGDSALYVLSITSNKATLSRQPVDEYRRTIHDFMSLLTSTDAMRQTVAVQHFLVLSNSLYSQLLASLNLAAGRVIISPDGLFVPFETLSRSPKQPDYLVNTYAFSYAYSAGLLLKGGHQNSPSPGFRNHDFLGVAPVTFAPGLGQASLLGSDRALDPIAGQFNSPMLLTHRTATRRNFLKNAPNYRFIQLFTHAAADSTDLEPRLYFADSTLKLSDLADGALPNAQMVVLTACQTGTGANQRGEGIFSLARGFATLGVRSILTTLWPVEDRATYSLTQLFYQHLAEGLPKDVALQRAKQDWLKTTDGASLLPTVWAGLIIIGDTEPLDRVNRWIWWVAGFLVLSGVGAFCWQFVRKRRVARPVISFLRPV